MNQGLPDLRVVNFSGPSRDAATGEVIWRHRALDADGICAPGISVYFVVLCGVWKISGVRRSKSDERNPKINPTWILIPIACQIWMPSRVFLKVLFIKFDYFLLLVAFDWFAKTAVSSKPIRYKTVFHSIFFSSSFFVRWEGGKQTSSHQQIHACCHCFRASARYDRAIVIVYIWKRKSFLLI